jgi:hypothetical protein
MENLANTLTSVPWNAILIHGLLIANSSGDRDLNRTHFRQLMRRSIWIRAYYSLLGFFKSLLPHVLR